MNARVTRIDHIQIAAPQGCEAAAREFYGSLLGLQEIEKPASLGSRGGCWFQCGNQQLHIGVEQNFRAAQKAHPAFVTSDLDELRQALIARGIKVSDDESISGTRRFHTEDPWGNRLEFVESPAPNPTLFRRLQPVRLRHRSVPESHTLGRHSLVQLFLTYRF